jgi:predicted transcriptional regulator
LLHNTNRRGILLSQELTQAVLADYKAGVAIAKIARNRGVSRMTVYRIIERDTPNSAGAQKGVRVYTRLADEDLDALKKLASDRGETVAAISRRVLRRASGFFDADREVSAAALQLTKELKKIGQNLNQVVYQINREAALQGRASPNTKHLESIRLMQTTVLGKADEVNKLLVRAGRKQLTTVAELLDKAD